MSIIDNNLLDSVKAKAIESDRKRMNFNFHTSPDSKAQRLLNALEPGTDLPIHRHHHSDETYVLLRGKINVMFYNDKGEETERFSLDPLIGNFGVHIPKGVWHTLEVLESGSTIFEVKDGPYTPLGEDDVMCGTSR